MSEKFDYQFYFEQALQMIKSTRQSIAERTEVSDFKWNTIVENKLFNFIDQDYENYSMVLNAAQRYSNESIMIIILRLLEINKVKAKVLTANFPNIPFSIFDEDKREIYLFHDLQSIGDSVGISISLENADKIDVIMKNVGAKSYKYVYLMKDKAYYLDATYKLSKSDPTHGTNLYYMKWFFETYFGREEYENFTRELEIYIQKVRECLGYILAKSLTPNVLINFTKITEKKICNFNYSDMRNKKIIRQINNKEFELTEVDYEMMKSQFISNHYYKVLIGKSDFAESLITAEWLYDSMLKAKAVDLTMIGSGYFKCVEQLLYEIICLHQTDNSINQDVTLGAMATFVKNHMQIFRTELSWKSKNYIREAIFKFAKLRNGYFHKHNIHSKEKIDEIKNTTFNLLFLLVGACKLSNADMSLLKMPEEKVFNDYYRLCKYIDYHSGHIFFIQDKDGKEIFGTACYDPKLKIVDGHEIYSGIYIKEPKSLNKVNKITELNLPFCIYLGKIEFNVDSAQKVRLSKATKVFEDGKFLVTETEEEYNNY